MKSLNDKFSEWIILQAGGKDRLDEKVPAWIAMNNGIVGSTHIHKRIRHFLDARMSAASITWDPWTQEYQLYSLQDLFLEISRLCKESVSDDELQTYRVLYA